MGEGKNTTEDNPPTTTTDSTPTARAAATTTDGVRDDIPPLTTYQANAKNDRIDALRLVADSVAQQRQEASRAVISHPAVLALTTAVLAIVFGALYHDRSDLGLVLTTMAGCVMAGLAGVGYATSGYLELAERTGTWAWLYGREREKSGAMKEREKEEDIILVTKYGDEIIGTVVLRLLTSEQNSESSKSKKSKSNAKSKDPGPGFTAVIRAWTVKRRYRTKGIGTGLLEEAVSFCRKNSWEGPVFDEHHANSVRLLPAMFLGDLFEKRETRARRALENVKRRLSSSPS